MKSELVVVLLACAGVAGADPAPGMDLEGPVPPPARGARRPGKGVTLDLGADRPAVTLQLPRPPAGAAAVFTFADGRKGWVARIPETAQLPSVAYGGGRIFVSGGFDSRSFYALDAGDGHMLWASQQLEDNGPTAPTFEDDRVIFNTESCTLFAIDARSGRKLWFRTLGDPTLAQPSVADGLVFASHPSDAGGQALSALRIENGRRVWQRPIDAELLAAPIVAGGALYAATLSGRVYRFEARTGKRSWSKPLLATSAPWVVGDELFLSRRAGDKEEQVVVSAETGQLLRAHRAVRAGYLADVPRDMDSWQKVWGFEGSRPVVVDGVRYEGTGDSIQASDVTTGEAFWTRRHPKGGRARSLGAVAVAGSQVVVASRAGQLYGLDIDTGYTLWSYDLGKPITAQPIIARGWIYATTTDGQVVALNVADASLDGWHMWGGSPSHNG